MCDGCVFKIIYNQYIISMPLLIHMFKKKLNRTENFKFNQLIFKQRMRAWKKERERRRMLHLYL